MVSALPKVPLPPEGSMSFQRFLIPTSSAFLRIASLEVIASHIARDHPYISLDRFGMFLGKCMQ